MAPAFPELNVLVVDDDSFTLELFADLLRSIGVQSFTTAASGEEVLQLLSQGAGIQVLISDLYMPDMDGIELFTKLKEINFNGAIILVSAAKQEMLESTRQLAEMHGLNILGALTKPARRGDLAALLRII